MSAMTHDDFLKRLAELEPRPGHEPSSLEDRLGAEAAGHAAGCQDCARTAQALLRLADDENALHDEPPADYWQGFDARLAERLEGLERPVVVSRSGAAWSRALRVAAVLAVVAGLGALVLRQADDASEPDRRAGNDEARTIAPVDEYDEALAAWSDEANWTAEMPDTGRAFAALDTDEILPGLQPSPADSLHDELSRVLDDAQAAELARLLRAEISS